MGLFSLLGRAFKSKKNYNDNATLSSQSLDGDELDLWLSDGPMRFAPMEERTIQAQIDALDPMDRECFLNLKMKWEEKHKFPFTDEMILRFARWSADDEGLFQEKKAWKAMNRVDRNLLELRAGDVKKQLRTKTLFPIPGLKTKEGHDVFYMRPSRYSPRKTLVETIIKNLAYCMNTMVEKEQACTHGIGFVANMDDWKMSNFSLDYCMQFMKTLQGGVAVKVRLFLIVNPPSWFNTIWRMMKPMLSEDFRERVHMIPEDDLANYLMENYDKYLPDDIQSGKASTDEMVADFVKYRKYIEGPGSKDL